MKIFFSYFKYHLHWFLLIVCSGVMMALVMYLNQIPAAEILYGELICVALLCMAIAWGYYRYQRKYHRLQELEKTVTVSLQNMIHTDEVLEAEYQKMVETLFAQKTAQETESLNHERDLMEYYTMWVHQIKTPIAALRLLLQENGGGEEVTAYRMEELQELFRIEQYVEMALQYMRLASESTDFILEKVELDGVIREAVRKFARQFISKKIVLQYETVNTTVVTDEKWLEFVVEQLLSNALKYTQKGSITIRVENAVSEEEEPRQIALLIEDTGIGIRAEDLPRVCEKGYTGYNGHEDKRSTGIGLYLCRSILTKLNHKMTITSKEGIGTKVSINLTTM